ncbi:hypothetical protein ACTXT7_011191 [Hymenolepis weldensis]
MLKQRNKQVTTNNSNAEDYPPAPCLDRFPYMFLVNLSSHTENPDETSRYPFAPPGFGTVRVDS